MFSDCGMALGGRIGDTLRLIGKDQAWLAKATETDARTLSAVITRDSERSVYAPAWAQALGIELHWALTGDGPRFAVDPVGRFGPGIDLAQEVRKQNSRFNTASGPRMRDEVPLISWVQAGSWNDVEDPYAVGDAEKWMPCAVAHGKRTFALRVRGESMFNPTARVSFADGDIIFVDPDQPADSGAFIIARLDNGMEGTFKQLIIEGDRRYLKALNPAWPEPIIRIDESTSVTGKVIGKFVQF